MGKVRTCPKCGRIESQYTYFCTECGTKTIESDGQVPLRKENTVGVSNAYKEQKPGVKAVTPADVTLGPDSLSAQRVEADNVSSERKIENDASSDSVTAQKNAPSVTISKKTIGIIAGALVVVIGVILAFSIGRNNTSNDNLQLASKAENESNVGYSDSYELHADDGYKEQEQEYYLDQNEAEHSESVDYVEVPNWFVVNGVAVKGNELCFSRDDSLQMGNGECPLTVKHYVFNDSGSLYSMNEYIIFENEWSASQYADELNSYNNEGKNNFGMQMGDTRYYSVGNILVEEFLPQYTQYNVGTLQDEITMFSDYGWSIEYVSSDGQQVDGDSYILSGSDSRFVDKSELRELSADECRLARNEIYARHGRMFSDEVLQEYFNMKDWYDPWISPDDFQESMLNDYEIYNRDLIVEYEKEMGYR